MAKMRNEELVQEIRARIASRISTERRRSPAKLRQVFARLEREIFEETNTRKLIGKVGARSDAVASAFRSQIGSSPARFVEELRIDAAKALLKQSSEPVWRIATAAGFSSADTFRRKFKQLSKSTPEQYRKNLASEDVAELSKASDEKAREVWPCVLRSNDCLPAEARMLEWLGEKMAEAALGETRQDPGWECIERVLAKWAWHHTVVVQQTDENFSRCDLEAFSTPAHFELLMEMSREVGRADRTLGAKVARQALHSLRHLGWLLEEREFAHLRARAWSNLGNALRLKSDFLAAEEALEQARTLLNVVHSPSLQLRFELALFTCCLRIDQRRLAEAESFTRNAVLLAQESEEPNFICQSYMAQGNILWLQGSWMEAVDVFNSAVKQLGSVSDPYLRIAAYQSLAAAYLKGGEVEAAEMNARRAQSIVEESGDKSGSVQLQWLMGLIALELGDLEKARQRLIFCQKSFEGQEHLYQSGLVSLDLAILSGLKENNGELRKEASKALVFLAAFDLDGECLAALELLRQAVKQQRIAQPLLRQLRATLGRRDGAPALPD